MAERRFTRLKASLSETAAKTRETVSRELRQSLISDSNTEIDTDSVSFDFERQHSSQNHANREPIFVFPANDVQCQSVPKQTGVRKRPHEPTPTTATAASTGLFGRECIRHYDDDRHVIHFASDRHSGSLYETCLSQSGAKFELKAHAFDTDDELIGDDLDQPTTVAGHELPAGDSPLELNRLLQEKPIDLRPFEINLFTPFNGELQSRKGSHISLRQRSPRGASDELSMRSRQFVLTVARLEFALKQASGQPIENYFCCLSLFDVKLGKKVSEEFRFKFTTSAANTNTDSGGNKSPLIGSRGYNERWLSRDHNRAIFTIDYGPIHSLYLVLRVEKCLSKNSADFYANVSQKNAARAHKLAVTSPASPYSEPFVWSAKPLQLRDDREMIFDQLYRQESGKLSDDFVVQSIGNGYVGLAVIGGKFTAKIAEYQRPSSPSKSESVLNSALFPVSDTVNPEIRPLIHVEPLEPSARPNTEFVHLMYVYPQCVRFDSAKAFSKARNIAVTIELRDSDHIDAKPLPIIFNPELCPVFVTQVSSPVSRHSVAPDFYHEIKVGLPLSANFAKFHILFSFYHVSCKDFTRTLIGYSWLGLQRQMHTETGVQLSVFGSLPNGYLSCQSLGLGKGFSFTESELRFVGKDLFRVSLRLVSTVMSRDPELQQTMLNVTRITCSSRDDSKEISKLIAIERSLHTKQLKTLAAVDRVELIRFSQVILQHLFRLVVYSINGELLEQSLQTVLSLVAIIDSESVLNEFVDETFTYSSFGDHLFHEQLVITLNKFDLKLESQYRLVLKNVWFLLRILIKSLVQSKLDTFSAPFNQQLKQLIGALSSLIVTQSRDNIQESRDANRAITHFLSRLLSVYPLGQKAFAFRLVLAHLGACSQSRDIVLSELRLQSVAIITAHEHYVPLNACPNATVKLSNRFLERHFFAYILLSEFKSCVNSQSVRHVRQQAIIILRNLLAKHSFDSRYQSHDSQMMVTSIYLPLLEIVIDNINRLIVDTTAAAARGLTNNGIDESSDDTSARSKTMNQNFWSVLSQTNQMFSMDISSSSTTPFAPQSQQSRHSRMNSLPIRLDFLNADEIRDILVACLQIVKYHAAIALKNLGDKQVDDLYRLLEICIETFEYRPNRCADIRAKTLPTNAHIETDLLDYLSRQNLTIQTSFIALKWIRVTANADDRLVRHNFALFLTLLSKPQSEHTFSLIFADLRRFFRKFSAQLFAADSCLPKLVDKLVSFCNSRSPAVRLDACATLVALFFVNYELKRDARKTSFQTIVCVSRFASNYSNLSRFEWSITQMERHYGQPSNDSRMEDVLREFRKTIARVREIVLATREIRAHSSDQFVACELRLKLADSLTSRELRRTWLEGVVALHTKNGNSAEAGMTLCRVVVILLKRMRSLLTAGAVNGCPVEPVDESLALMAKMSADLRRDVSKSDDESDGEDSEDNQVTLSALESVINDCVELFESGELYEYAAIVLKVLIAFYESDRSHDKLAVVYERLSKLHLKCDAANRSGKRLFATYFRVAFASCGGCQEWVVREPKIVSLAEFHERTQRLYPKAKFAASDGELKAANSEQLVVMVTHVTPVTGEPREEWDRHCDVDRFMYESAISQSNDVRSVSKRRVVLTCEHSFPYCARRLRVARREENVLSPIDVACQEMSERVARLQHVLSTRDVKLIQLILQGSVNVTVNAGPLVYATAFLSGSEVADGPECESQRLLRRLFEKFVVLCERALKLNNELISDNQLEYHHNLKLNFDKLKAELTGLLSLGDEQSDGHASLNTSSRIFDVISGHSFA